MEYSSSPAALGGHLELKTRRLIAFALLAALLATFLTDYRYAEVGIEEIDPMIRRAMDPGYLSNDFFTNTTDEFGPRFYFAHLIAAISNSKSLPFVYFALTLAINACIALVTGMFASGLFKSKMAGLAAIALVMGASSFSLGGAGQAHASEPISYWLSFPLAIAAVWAATRARPALVGLLTGSAILLHPAFGAAAAGLTFGALVVALLIRKRNEGTRTSVFGVGRGLVLLGILVAPVVVPYSREARIPDEQLMDIFRTRLPHHLLPSTFGEVDWLGGLFFVIAVGVAWSWLRERRLIDPFAATVLLALFAGLVLFFLCGYLFVEVWPWKPWFLAVPYRATSYVLWLGLVVIGGSAARRATASLGEGALLLASSFNPIGSGLAHLSMLFVEKGRGRSLVGVGGVFVFLLVGVAFTDLRDLVQFAIIVGLAGLFALGPERVWVTAVSLVVPLAIAGALIVVQVTYDTPGALDRIGPEILPSQVEGPEADIAAAANTFTPEHSVILTPPTFGTFRVLAQRAIVVDVRTIPYQEVAMAEWMDRILTVYGVIPAAIFEREDSGEDHEILNMAYVTIDDESIRHLCELYPFTHAVLFTETPTAYPTIEENDTYRLVALGECG